MNQTPLQHHSRGDKEKKSKSKKSVQSHAKFAFIIFIWCNALLCHAEPMQHLVVFFFFCTAIFLCVFYPIDRSIFPCIEKMPCIWSPRDKCVCECLFVIYWKLGLKCYDDVHLDTIFVTRCAVCCGFLETLHMHIGNVVLFNEKTHEYSITVPILDFNAFHTTYYCILTNELNPFCFAAKWWCCVMEFSHTFKSRFWIVQRRAKNEWIKNCMLHVDVINESQKKNTAKEPVTSIYIRRWSSCMHDIDVEHCTLQLISFRMQKPMTGITKWEHSHE